MRVNEDLLKRLKVGDEKAFEDLYWTYSPQVYNFINSLLFDKSLAEDLTQNVFLVMTGVPSAFWSLNFSV